MVHLIDKDTLETEIERRTDELWALIPDGEKVISDKHTKEDAFNLGKYTALESLGKFIDTLDVKEVDLEKEIDEFYGMYRDKNGVTHDMQDNEICLDWKEDCNYHFKIDFAKHFFELGLRVNNEKEK